MASKYIPPLSLTGFGFLLFLLTPPHTPAINWTSASCFLSLFPPAFLPLLALIPPCWSSDQVPTWGQGLKAHQVCQSSHLAATPMLPASCLGHSMTCCGTAVWNTLGGCLPLPGSPCWPQTEVWFCLAPILLSCALPHFFLLASHFGISSFSHIRKEGKFLKISAAVSRLAILLALHVARHRWGRLPGT